MRAPLTRGPVIRYRRQGRPTGRGSNLALPMPEPEEPKPEPEEAEESTLRLVAEQACAQAHCVAAGVTLVRGNGSMLVVGTSLLGRQLEQAQWDLGQGPGLDAIRQLQVFNVACLVTARSWPNFLPQAVSRGVRSSLAVPIVLRGQALGALDLYSYEPAAFEGVEQVGLHFATEAAIALSASGERPDARTPRPVPRPHGPGRSHAAS